MGTAFLKGTWSILWALFKNQIQFLLNDFKRLKEMVVINRSNTSFREEVITPKNHQSTHKECHRKWRLEMKIILLWTD